MWLGALLAVVVLGLPVTFLIGLVHGIQRATDIGVRPDRSAPAVSGPADDSRDQVDLSAADRVQFGGSSMPRLTPFVSTCAVLTVGLLAIALAIGLAEH